jgi:hypothetical protein
VRLLLPLFGSDTKLADWGETKGYSWQRVGRPAERIFVSNLL